MAFGHFSFLASPLPLALAAIDLKPGSALIAQALACNTELTPFQPSPRLNQ
jgi:hypothetical protein